MNEEQVSQNEPNTPTQGCDWKKHFCTVTPFSKYLALALFVALPFVGFWVWNDSVQSNFSVTYSVLAPFSSATITIASDRKVSYFANVEMAEFRDKGSLTVKQMQTLQDLFKEVDFYAMQDRLYDSESPADGSQYSITFAQFPTGPDAYRADAVIHSVSCYQFNCEEDFLKLRSTIVEFWGREVHEVGV